MKAFVVVRQFNPGCDSLDGAGGQPEGRQDQSEPGDGDDHDLPRPHALLFPPLSDGLRGQRSTSRSRLTQ